MPTFRGVRLVSNPSAVLRNGLAAEWLMNESGSTLTDTSGNGNHGTIYGASWYTLPSEYKVLSLDGDDYVDVPDDPTLNPTQCISVEHWIYPEVLTSGVVQRIVQRKAGTWGTLIRGDLIRFYVDTTDDGGSWKSAECTIPSTNKWYNIAAVYDGVKIYLYMDGELRATTPQSHAINQPPAGAPLQIGRDHLNVQYFQGLIGVVRIYKDRTLQPWEIQALYNYDKALMGI
ncbi:hypothetical protein DRO48_01015 [Candidatus Bathyarchaeota archaeon]|nr:MAG: hypothetical protein DRO48_01015 [Candidatus Bathyarchaeota archaeon]